MFYSQFYTFMSIGLTASARYAAPVFPFNAKEWGKKMYNNILTQLWLSHSQTGVVLIPRGHLMMSRGISDCHNLGGDAPGIVLRSGMLLNVLQGSGQPTPTKSFLAPNVNSVEVGSIRYGRTRRWSCPLSNFVGQATLVLLDGDSIWTLQPCGVQTILFL